MKDGPIPQPAEVVIGPHLFALPEYSAAAQHFVLDGIEAIARAKSPLYDQIHRERSVLPMKTRISIDPAAPLDAEPFMVETEFGYNPSKIVSGDYSGVYESMFAVADELLKQVIPQLFGHIGRVTDATGNTISLKGAALSWDSIIDMLEEMDIEFDDQDQPKLQWVGGPELTSNLQALPPPTPAQVERATALLKRKLEEARARRGSRTLLDFSW